MKMIIWLQLNYCICTGCGRKTWRFSSPVILATVWGGVMQPRSVA